ncbi:dUTPase [Synechococcus phage S-CBWM1]|uniref:dUTP diphosphatase n=1 Tax=Synechococcus phage S-CBWM1 TaxID=2053653 RepID=A0A3G1L3Q3_9CAUD|nr:dUTPase [Synechococcus phage S-CBWM1]ATW62811.1 dUTPase [Synechococcus phage S-CBWM1]
MRILTKKTHPNATIPVRATEHAAAYDFFSTEDFDLRYGEAKTIGTGISVAIPNDHVLLMFSRSGHGFKHNISLANCVGVIDADYRGEIKVKLSRPMFGSDTVWADSEVQYSGMAGDRIAQGMLVPRVNMEFEEVGALPESGRGDGGFGHTGA